ncbi:MAG: CCA tRNA nucleotidyltransferase [Spirochaetes bacterium]|nr:CCA tRNA nucleotidyltransferase [Spirochaetota bacterium]
MKTYTINLEIPDHIAKEIKAICATLQDRGYECYLIGGSVRDLILGLPVYDYDFATNAYPEEVMKLFKRVVPTGIKHGTVTVCMRHAQYEITTYRADGKYTDGRHPDLVMFSKTLKEDVERRDFTINGLAYDVINHQIIDYVGGMEDIDKRIIRTIGNPLQRFSEDGLRPYRACRLAAKLHCSIHKDTLEAIPQVLEIAKKISVERVRDEIKKMLEADKPSEGFEYLRVTGLLNLCMPELAEGFGMQQNKYHMYDIYYHSIYSCDAAPKEKPLLRMAALLHDIGKIKTRREGSDGDYTFYNHEVISSTIARKIMRRLKFSNDEIEYVCNLIVNHMFHYTPDWTDGAVRRFIRKVGLDNLEDLFVLRMADRCGNGMRDGLPEPIKKLKRHINKVIEKDNAFTVRDLDIDGYILMEQLNLKPGPTIGKILNELLERVLDNPELNNEQTLLALAHEIYAAMAQEANSRHDSIQHNTV